VGCSDGPPAQAGAYEDWRKAWWGDGDEVPAGVEVYILRKLDDPDEVIAFGLIEASREDFEAMRPDDPAAEEARQARMRRISRTSSLTAHTRSSSVSRRERGGRRSAGGGCTGVCTHAQARHLWRT